MANRLLKTMVSRCNVLPCNLTKNPCLLNTMTNRSYTSILDRFDPPYLEDMKPKVPVYEPINVQIKGYDFALVESYQSLVHNVARMMELEVDDGWATPATSAKVNRFKPLSGVIDSSYNLNLYERNVQILDLPGVIAPTFIELIQAGLPQGLTITVQPHTEDYEEIRYVPEYELDELKTELSTLTRKDKK